MYKTIRLSKLKPNIHNPNRCSAEVLTKIRENIHRTHQCPPLIVRPLSQGKYQIIDGHHRWQILKDLGWKEAPCVVWEVDDTEANIALATLNRLHGEDDPFARAELVQQLHQQFELEQLSQWLPETTEQLTDLLTLLKADQAALERQVNAAIKAQQDALPTLFSIMLPPGGEPIVLEALKGIKGSDQGERLVNLCQKHLTTENCRYDN